MIKELGFKQALEVFDRIIAHKNPVLVGFRYMYAKFKYVWIVDWDNTKQVDLFGKTVKEEKVV